MEVGTARGVLAVGLLLLLLNGLFPPVAIVGYGLALYGLKTLSSVYGRAEIYRNFLYAFFFYLASVALLLGVFAAAAAQAEPSKKAAPPDWGPAAAVFLALWALGVASAFFAKRSYAALGEASGVSAFKTAARLVWIGALLTIVLVGPVITFIGLAFAVAGALAIRATS